jgi:hypothetical protein
MLLLLVGCLDPISNRLFFEDAEFLDALPSADDDRVQVYTHSAGGPGGDDDVTEPGEELVAPEGAPGLLVLTVDSVNGVNAMIDGLLGFVDAVRAIPPSSRTEDARTWGPFPMDDVPGFDVRMVSTRDGLSQFTWSFDTAPHGTSSWTTFFSGVHIAGAPVRECAGSFAFDGVTLDQLRDSDDVPFYLEVTYDRIEGNEVTFEVSTDGSLSAVSLVRYGYEIDADDSGSFTFDTSSPLFEGGDGKGKPEHWQVTSRWIPDVGGRGDATLSEGDLGPLKIGYTECWLPDGTLLFMDDTWNYVKPFGSPEDCTVAPPR